MQTVSYDFYFLMQVAENDYKITQLFFFPPTSYKHQFYG